LAGDPPRGADESGRGGTRTEARAALKMKVEDLRPRGAGGSVRLHEKGGKHHTMPCHHALAEALHAYISAAGVADDRKGWLFRTARGHNGKVLSEDPLSQPDAWRMIRRRAVAAGVAEAIGCHTFRATGITAYLANGGALEHAQEMAAHESPRGQPSSTTGRRNG
jgi:integrase